MRKITMWPLGKLLRSRFQDAYFCDLPDLEYGNVLGSMRSQGLLQPIEILPTGEIIDGHQRVRAAQDLGWTEIECIVRDDLAECDEAAIEHRVIDANLNRRQLGQLEVARLYKRVRELQRKSPDGTPSPDAQGDLRDRVAAKLGSRSGRTLDRYLRLLELPVAIQNAFEDKQLPLTRALQVLKLSEQNQHELAGEIEDGAPIRETVARYLGGPQGPSSSDQYRKLILLLENAGPVLTRDIEQIAGNGAYAHQAIPALERAVDLLPRLLKLERGIHEKRQAKLAAQLAELAQFPGAVSRTS